jgi:hypothetical protein
MKVRRKTYWVDRYGFIATNKGLVYAKSKNDMKNARYFTLKNKKIMKGKRNNNDEYIAICNPKSSGDGVEVKISFSDRGLLEKWGKIIMGEIEGKSSSEVEKAKEKMVESPAKFKTEKVTEKPPVTAESSVKQTEVEKDVVEKEPEKKLLSETVDVTKQETA